MHDRALLDEKRALHEQALRDEAKSKLEEEEQEHKEKLRLEVSQKNLEAMRRTHKSVVDQYREESAKPFESEIYATIALKEFIDNKSPQVIKQENLDRSRVFLSQKVD